MGELAEIARTDNMKDGAMKKVNVSGRDLLLARVGDKYYCADSRCPHLNGDLSRGTLAGTIITCPDHFSQFDMASGAVIRWTNLTGMVARLDRRAHPPKTLTVYEIKVEGDRVLVRLP